MSENNKKAGLIVGAGGAIGLQLVAQAQQRGIGQIYATHRSPVTSVSPDTHWLHLDYNSVELLDAATTYLLMEVHSLDFLVVATGLLHAEGIKPEKRLSNWSEDVFAQVMWINAGAPLTLFSRLQPILKRSNQPKVIFLSAQIGSIEDNRSGGWYSYRMSKAALNMGVRTAAIEAERWQNQASVVAVHPGTTRSSLSKPYTSRRQNLLTPVQTATDLYNLLDTIGPANSGQLMTRLGEPLPF